MGFLFLSYWLLEEIIRLDRVLKIDVIYCKNQCRNNFSYQVDKLENSLYQRTEKYFEMLKCTEKSWF